MDVSAMDVSFNEAASPSPHKHHQDDFSEEREDEGAPGEVGYQGWSARRLLLASHRIFLNEGHGGGNGGDRYGQQQQHQQLENPVAVSLLHRGAIYWCLVNMDAVDIAAPSAANMLDADDAARQLEEDENVFHDGLTDFYHVWTLAEAFLLDSLPLPAAPLLRWLNMYCQSNEEQSEQWELEEAESAALAGAAAAADGGGSAEATPAYWKALRSLVVGVMPRRAAHMLRCHPEGRDNAGEVGALARQLEKMPLLLPERPTDVGGTSGGAADVAALDREGFFETWKRWQKGCKAAAASFGVVAGAGGSGGSIGFDGGGDVAGDERRRLRWLWGTLCGERGCLEEGTTSWCGLFAAVLAFERPDVRKEEVASVMRECAAKHPPQIEEDFLLNVIRDASTGAVDAILRFAQEHGNTLALSACAAHLVDLLWRAELPAVTNAQRAWFFGRLVARLKAFPCGGWEMAAAYVGAAARDGGGGGDEVGGAGRGAGGVDTRDGDGFVDRGTFDLSSTEAQVVGMRRGDAYVLSGDKRSKNAERNAGLLRQLVHMVAPGSERATHELVEWCQVKGLGDDAAATVCRVRGAEWIAKTGISAEAMGTSATLKVEVVGGSDHIVSGACGKAAYWLAKGGGGVQLERLCAEVSERLMTEVSSPGGGEVSDAQQKARTEALAEAEGVLASVPSGLTGSELYFLERYKDIADIIFASPTKEEHPRTQTTEVEFKGSRPHPSRVAAGNLAVDLLAPCGRGVAHPSEDTQQCYPPPPRSWPHLFRLALPALRASATAAAEGGSSDGNVPIITAPQVHVLLGKLQVLVASEHRVGGSVAWEREGRGQSELPSSYAACVAPYGFRSGRDEVREIRKALASCLGAAMMVQNADLLSDTRRGGVGGNGRAIVPSTRKRLPAEAMIAPRVSVAP